MWLLWKTYKPAVSPARIRSKSSETIYLSLIINAKSTRSQCGRRYFTNRRIYVCVEASSRRHPRDPASWFCDACLSTARTNAACLQREPRHGSDGSMIIFIRRNICRQRWKATKNKQNTLIIITRCAGGRHNMPPPPASWPLTFWLWKWCPSHALRGLPLCSPWLQHVCLHRPMFWDHWNYIIN